jgi:two-component system, chemotaxis family, chemotaxis protein CheY
MTQVADIALTETIVFDLPPAVDAAGAMALIADMVRLPQGNEISLNAAAVSEVSLGYLQILASAFKTFPKLTVSGASAEFAEVFDGYGIAYPFGEPPVVDIGAAPVVAEAAGLEMPSVALATAEIETPAVQEMPVNVAPSLVPAAGPGQDPAPMEAVTAAQDPAPAVQAEAAAASEAAAVKTILTIDDSRTMRDMLRLALSSAGFTVVQAVDGQDGLKVLPQQPVDVIITDINMPKLDGYGVIRAVRGDPAYNDTPILVLSTEAEQGSKDIANEAGANGWIVKPFDPEGLIKLINTVCE